MGGGDGGKGGRGVDLRAVGSDIGIIFLFLVFNFVLILFLCCTKLFLYPSVRLPSHSLAFLWKKKDFFFFRESFVCGQHCLGRSTC